MAFAAVRYTDTRLGRTYCTVCGEGLFEPRRRRHLNTKEMELRTYVRTYVGTGT